MNLSLDTNLRLQIRRHPKGKITHELLHYFFSNYPNLVEALTAGSSVRSRAWKAASETAGVEILRRSCSISCWAWEEFSPSYHLKHFMKIFFTWRSKTKLRSSRSCDNNSENYNEIFHGLIFLKWKLQTELPLMSRTSFIRIDRSAFGSDNQPNIFREHQNCLWDS